MLLAGSLTAQTEGETELQDPARNAAWAPLFAQLAPNKNRQSNFEEHRYFPFRKTPTILKGEIRIMPDRGLSLRYLEPEAHTLIVDKEGLLMRNDEGRQRAAPSDSRAQQAIGALMSVLRFDVAELEKNFTIYGRRAGDAWSLSFVPRETSLRDLTGTLRVHGTGAHLDRIEMVKSDKQRIEILITDTQDNVLFPANVIARFFR